jgi:hypothetical protein
MTDNNWKWGETANKAMNLVNQFFGANVQSFKDVKDGEAKKILKAADDSAVQVQRSRDVINATRKRWKNQQKIGSAIHGLIRSGLDMIYAQRKEESKTAKHLAKTAVDTAVLNTRTRTTIERKTLRGQSAMRKTQNQLNLDSQEIIEAESVDIGAQADRFNQRRIGYRDRVQKRISAGQTPWRNY